MRLLDVRSPLVPSMCGSFNGFHPGASYGFSCLYCVSLTFPYIQSLQRTFALQLADEATTQKWVDEAIASAGAKGPSDMGKVSSQIVCGRCSARFQPSAIVERCHIGRQGLRVSPSLPGTDWQLVGRSRWLGLEGRDVQKARGRPTPSDSCPVVVAHAIRVRVLVESYSLL